MVNDNVNSKMLLYAKMSKELYDNMIEEEARKCGISKQEAHILLFFWNNPNFSNARDAVIYRRFSKAYVSKAIALLEGREFVSLISDSIDKRYQHIIINDKAKNVIIKLKSVQDEYYNSLKEGISSEEFITYIKVIDKIALNISKKMKG